eukprot:UN11224
MLKFVYMHVPSWFSMSTLKLIIIYNREIFIQFSL